MPAGSHRPDEDAVIGGVGLHPHAVPSKAPPEKGLEGSIARTPTFRSSLRMRATILSVSDDLPAPGAPVIPSE